MIRWANREAEAHGVDVILQLGDFGWWPRSGAYHQAFLADLDRSPVPWVFCDGNHEDHETLRHSATEPVELHPSVWHVPRGVDVTWSDRSFLFFGGAVSVDKHRRTPGLNWFANETASPPQQARALSAGKVDVVVAHDAPDGEIGLDLKPGIWPDDLTRASGAHRRFCLQLAEAVRPDLWLAGHYHRRTTGSVLGTRVEVFAGSEQQPWGLLAAAVLDIPTLTLRDLDVGLGIAQIS